jgi:hypothetical protein
MGQSLWLDNITRGLLRSGNRCQARCRTAQSHNFPENTEADLRPQMDYLIDLLRDE